MRARVQLNVEGAVAKYLATEAGDAAADAAIQAHGGYGYTHDYMVEKIKRDVRITRIYEGTSEIMEITIARGRWQEHLKSGGDYYHAKARELEALHAEHPTVGADIAALAHHALAELLEQLPCREVDPAPAHPDAPWRVDRPGRGRGRARPARAAGGGQAAESEGVAAPARRARWPPRAASTPATPPWPSRPRPSAGWREPTASWAISSSASTSRRSIGPRAGCSPTSARSPRRSTGACELDPDDERRELSLR